MSDTDKVLAQSAVCVAQEEVRRLLEINEQLKAENKRLQQMVEGLCDRVAAQSDLLTKRAEK